MLLAAATEHHTAEESNEDDVYTTVPPLNICDLESSTDDLPLPIYMYRCSKHVVVDVLVNNSSEYIKPDEYHVSY